MSKVKALDELRELGEKVKNSCFTGVHCDDVIELADAIEAEIAERFMELPVDADGMMLEIGDKLEYRDETMTLCGLIWDGADWYATNVFESTSWKPINRCHHVKPCTIEDVLKEFGDWYKHVAGGCDEPGIIAKYADELRGMGVGE